MHNHEITTRIIQEREATEPRYIGTNSACHLILGMEWDAKLKINLYIQNWTHLWKIKLTFSVFVFWKSSCKTMTTHENIYIYIERDKSNNMTCARLGVMTNLQLLVEEQIIISLLNGKKQLFHQWCMTVTYYYQLTNVIMQT